MRIYFMLFLCTLMCACGTTKKLSKSAVKELGEEIEISIPIKNEYLTDSKNALRSVSNGISLDWNVAKNIATTNCRAEIAMKINGKIKAAMENYTKQYSANTDKLIEREIGQTFEQYAIVFTEANISNIIELQNYSSRNSKTYEYTYWVAMEINKDEVINEIVKKFDKLPTKTKEQIDYNRDKFRNYLSNSIFNN